MRKQSKYYSRMRNVKVSTDHTASNDLLPSNHRLFFFSCIRYWYRVIPSLSTLEWTHETLSFSLFLILSSGLCPSFWLLQLRQLLESYLPFTALPQFGVLPWCTKRINTGFKRLRRKSFLYSLIDARSRSHYWRLFGIPAEFFVTLYMNNGHEWKWYLNSAAVNDNARDWL